MVGLLIAFNYGAPFAKCFVNHLAMAMLPEKNARQGAKARMFIERNNQQQSPRFYFFSKTGMLKEIWQ